MYPILKCISADKRSFSFFCALPFNPSFTALSQRHPFYNPSLSRLLLFFFFNFSFSGFHYKCHSHPLPLCGFFYIFIRLSTSLFESLPRLHYHSLFLSANSFFWHNSAASFTHFYQIIIPPRHSSLFCARLPPPIFISPFMPLRSRHSSPFEVCSAACAFVRLSTRACDWLCA